MSDQVFWDQLGLRQGATREEVRRAYRRLAREHHPDLCPGASEDRKALQQLKMIALNEAYAGLMGRGRPALPVAGQPAGRREAAAQQRGAAAAAPVRGLAPTRDAAYATYKQGFVHYSRALQGIEALYRSMSRSRSRPVVVHFEPRDDARQRFAAGLRELREAHEYFSRVLRDYEQSIWRRDAEVKLGRIERFTLLYRRILGNLDFGGSPRRRPRAPSGPGAAPAP